MWICALEKINVKIRSFFFFSVSSLFSPLYLYKRDNGRKIKTTDHRKWEVETSFIAGCEKSLNYGC